jgi:transcription elongation GreA/GreB family factor
MNIEQTTEEWVLAELESPEFSVGPVLEKLAEQAERGDRAEASALAEFAENALTEQGRVEDALSVLRLRTEWFPAVDVRKWLPGAIQNILGSSTDHRAFLKNCGLQGRVPVSECLDRLERLRALTPGSLCMDKTWGFGIVRSVDPFYEKVTVDFERKPEHEFSMSYAAETLRLLDRRHILAVRHLEPDRLAALVSEDPAEVVRMALRSYGPLNPVILQEKLCPDVLPAENWKSFWAEARKQLKKDPTAVVPSKRTDPVCIKEAAEAYDESWLRDLKSDRNCESILQKVADWHFLHQGQPVPATVRAALQNRLAFVINGAELMGPTVKPRAMMLAHAVDDGSDALDVGAYVDGVLGSDGLVSLLAALSARDMKAFVAFLMRVDRTRTLEALLQQLPRLDVTTLNEVLQLLIKEGEESACRDALQELTAGRRVEVELLSWLSRNMERLTEWALCSPREFGEILVLEMEKDYAGPRLKAQNQLRDRFAQRKWLKDFFDQLGAEGRERLFLRLKDSSAWPAMERRSVLGQIIKIYPELEQLMVAKPADKGDADARRGWTTSTRSYRERQLQYERIKKVDIPNNSRDIAEARAHGDLRENFEFKAAKEMQGILMRRQGELEQMLGRVIPTGFDDMPTDQVGPGSGVTIAYPDGETETFYILGVWDRDEELGIISCESKLAQALEGCRVGDELVVPSEDGERTCRIAAVSALPEPVRAWIRQVPEDGGKVDTAV